jgi:AcrR family transcriptional regulator
MGRPRTYDRDDVLQKAIRVFWEKGYEGAHLQELVEATGLNRFSLYKEFGGKAGLFQAAIETYLAGLADLAGILSRDPPGLDNLRAFYRTYLDWNFLHGCFALNTIREKHVIPDEAYARIEDFTRLSEALFHRNLAGARERGELAADTDVDGLAKLLTALDMGLLTYGIVAPGREHQERIVAMIEGIFERYAPAG